MAPLNHPPRRLLQSRAALAVAVSFLLFAPILGCSTGSKPVSNNANRPAAASPNAPPGKGQFKTDYTAVKNPEYAKLQATLKKARVLESLADNLNKVIALPTDITLSLDECNEVNAFYAPDKQRIYICYELLENFAKSFEPDAKSEAELETAISGTTMFIFFHELGHALVHVLDLPVTGKEEDAVDQLSTLILADGTDEGEQAVLTAAKWFLLEHQQNDTDIEQLAFWDEHSLDAQRFYNITCWLYGHDEKAYAGLVQNGFLPEDRAVRCADEYKQIDKSWSRLLEPHLKK